MDNKELLFSREIAAGVRISDLSAKKVFLGGAGNTGSQFLQTATRNFIHNVMVVDFDKEGYQSHNFPHSSVLLEYPEDIGKPKAETLALRASQKLLDKGLYVGRTMDVNDIGPGIIRYFDFAVACFDNISARRHLYKISRIANVPFIEVGIGKNGAQFQAFDHAKDATCYCCYGVEDPTAFYGGCGDMFKNDLEHGIAPATSVIGAVAANLAVLSIMNWDKESRFKCNCRYIFDAETFQLEKEEQVKNPNCDICTDDVCYDDVKELSGSVDTKTYAEFVNQLHAEFGNYTPVLASPFIPSVFCPKCGKEKVFNRPARRIRVSEIICPECLDKENAFVDCNIGAKGNHIDGIDPLPREYINYTLFDLGFPYGAYIDCANDEGDFITVTLKDDVKILNNFIKEK